MNAENFYVNFLSNNEHLLHFRVDFPHGKHEGAIVRNSTCNGVWQREERQISQFPFTRGFTFDLLFIADYSAIMIEINGQHFTKFSYRGDVLLKDVNKIEVKGDLAVQLIVLK
uniref:Galectin n=1 Tax=Ascaris lumbricoides TaxID=6252 RepID=A0A0M3IQH5_ASCLU